MMTSLLLTPSSMLEIPSRTAVLLIPLLSITVSTISLIPSTRPALFSGFTGSIIVTLSIPGIAIKVAAIWKGTMAPIPMTNNSLESFLARDFTPIAPAAPVLSFVIYPAFTKASGSPVFILKIKVVPISSGSPASLFFTCRETSLRP